MGPDALFFETNNDLIFQDNKEEIENNDGSNRCMGSQRSDSFINLKKDELNSNVLCNNGRISERLKSIEEPNVKINQKINRSNLSKPNTNVKKNFKLKFQKLIIFINRMMD